MKMILDIDYRAPGFRAGEKEEVKIRQAAAACCEMEGVTGEVEVSVSFVTSEEIRQLNNTYRQLDKPTDVLSFPMISPGGSLGGMLGDIVISVDAMLKQAHEYGHGVEREMMYLVVHSMLHLLGYDHMHEEEKKEMRRKEEQVMESLSLSRD